LRCGWSMETADVTAPVTVAVTAPVGLAVTAPDTSLPYPDPFPDPGSASFIATVNRIFELAPTLLLRSGAADSEPQAFERVSDSVERQQSESFVAVRPLVPADWPHGTADGWSRNRPGGRLAGRRNAERSAGRRLVGRRPELRVLRPLAASFGPAVGRPINRLIGLETDLRTEGRARAG
jgi:hypothetical protein